MREFFAQGMLCNVLAAIDLRSVKEPWAESFFDGEEAKHEAMLVIDGARAESTPRTPTGSA